MKPIPIVAADDDRIQITFEIPAGDTTVMVSVPRFDMIDEDELDAIQAGIDALDESLPLNKAQRQGYLLQLRPFTNDEQMAALEKLKLGQLTQLVSDWTERSAMPLGELLRSVENSSTESTRKRSARTSSTGDGPADT